MSERCLAVDLIRQHGCQRVAELGVWRGARAWRLLDETPVRELVLVDPWDETANRFETHEHVPPRMPPGVYHCTMGEPHQEQAALDAMAKAVIARAAEYGDRVRVLALPAVEAAALMRPASFDAVIWDAVHLYAHCRRDLEAWQPMIRPGGLVMGDGFGDKGVRQAVLDLFGGGKHWMILQSDFWAVGL